ncbi:MAG: T9SS type A sorting domain-containing protein, partial [Ignavibacteria bacterium]|nr:T9SS type A sorting domain-containing protein [Ignavibacteria bacterium]
SPYMLDIQTSTTVYFGSYKLHKSTNKGNNWTIISPDLTKGQNGRLGTITCMSNAVLPSTQRVIYTGADDGRVMVTTNSGTNWTDISAGLPVRYITDVVVDKRNPNVAYVTLSGFNMDERNTHVFRTINYGATWVNITGNLLNVPANSLIIDYNKDSTLFVGTDAGVYYTTRLGASWVQLGTGLPNSPVFDLIYHQASFKLVAATHGRSMFEVDISNLPSVINNNTTTANDFILKQNYPNPFNPETNISYELKQKAFVTLKVFDLSGKEVAVLVNGIKTPGSYNVKFRGADLSSGLYFYKLESGEFSEVKKMMLIK